MKVAVGISGGVDSAVAALLLKEVGHAVVGVTMTLGRADEERSLSEARDAAAWLGVPLHVLDLAEVWHREVLDFATETYRAGQTPNPCVRCNERVKFNLLPRWAFETLSCEAFATGHYARLDGGRLFRGVDHTKDQSYFLYRAPQDVLRRTLFPLGTLTKAEVRARAKSVGFPVATRADSQDFCGPDPRTLLGDSPPVLLGDSPSVDATACRVSQDETSFSLRRGKLPRLQDGEIVTVEGNVIGHHGGYWQYTVGQRKGLGVGGGTPYYVISVDSAQNRVIVGTKEQSVCYSFHVKEVCPSVGVCPPVDATYPPSEASSEGGAMRGACRFSSKTNPPLLVGTDPMETGTVPLFVKVRSAGEPKGPVTFDGATCSCPAGIAGVAPGQSAVFYRGEEVIGGGIIV